MKPALAHLTAIAIAILAIVATTVGWIVHLPPVRGLTASASAADGLLPERGQPGDGPFMLVGLAGATMTYQLMPAWLHKDGGRP